MNERLGKFITLEGIEGAGKSTHMPFIADLLRTAGKKVVMTREPGGTPLGEEIRKILLEQKSFKIDSDTELLLMFAARIQHLQQIIRPAIARGKIVLCDRFTDSSYAYQGGGRGIAQEKIQQLEQWIQGDMQPDLTLLFDVPVEVGLSRINTRKQADRFETEAVSFFEKVRKAYFDLAHAYPERIKIIDAKADIEIVQSTITTLLREQGLC